MGSSNVEPLVSRPLDRSVHAVSYFHWDARQAAVAKALLHLPCGQRRCFACSWMSIAPRMHKKTSWTHGGTSTANEESP